MSWLAVVLEKEFGDRFSFLKLLDVNYNKKNRQCLVTFLYPENKTLDDEEKAMVENLVKKQLNISGLVSVKFRKSYLDNNLIEKSFFDFLKNEYPSISAVSDKIDLKIEKSFNNTEIVFNIDKTSSEYINEKEFINKVKKELEENFCSDFSISLNKVESLQRISNLKNEKTEFFSQKTPRYEVQIIYNIFGGDITPKPEFIKYIKTEKASVILAGKIEELEKKSYESKKPKTKGQTKQYYCFCLNDSVSRIDVKYFTATSNEKKMDKLVNGDEVLILGNIKSFNNKLSLYIKAISKCKLPEKIEEPVIFSNEYEIVKPESYSILSQDNLFKKASNYTEDIYKNDYVVFDVETTGLDYENDELVEIGAVRLQDGRIISKFNSLIKPKNPIPESATLINNITNSMVANCPNVDVVIRDFYRFSRNSKMVGYNVAFDQRFVQKAAKSQGLFFDNEFIDVLPIAKAKLVLSRYKLTDVVKRLEINLEGAHRALADSLATAEAFLQLKSDNYA